MKFSGKRETVGTCALDSSMRPGKGNLKFVKGMLPGGDFVVIFEYRISRMLEPLFSFELA